MQSRIPLVFKNFQKLLILTALVPLAVLLFSASASGAEVEVTIGPAGSLPGGGDPDYANINAAEANVVADTALTSKDLVSQGVNVTYKCYGERTVSSAEIVNGWTTSSNYTLTIEAGSGQPVISATSAVDVLDLNDPYVNVSGLHLLASSGSEKYALKVDADYCTVSGCILNSTDASSAWGNYCTNLRSNVTYDNCTFTGGRVFSNISGTPQGIEISGCAFENIMNTAEALLYNYQGIGTSSIHHSKFINVKSTHILDIYELKDGFKFYNNLVDCSQLGEACIYSYESDVEFDGDEIHVFNNTFHGVDGIECIALERINDGNVYVYNNVIQMSSGYAIYAYSVDSSNYTADYNCVYRTGGYYGYYSGSRTTLSDWQSASPWGDDSIEADPDFLSIDSSDPAWLHISQTSPCVDNGLNLADQGFTWITDDVDGHPRPGAGEPWAMGADEFPSNMPLGLQGYLNTHSSPGAAFDNGAWGNTTRVHFTWDCASGTAGFYWYWGTTAPSAGDYAYTTNKYTEAHIPTSETNCFYVMGTDGIENSLAATYLYKLDLHTPTAPSPCYCEDQINPNSVGLKQPGFKAVYNDSTGVCAEYNLQVGTSAGGSDMWDSGWIATSETSDGQNCSTITYAGSELAANTVYYWRVRFKDKAGNEGSWSANQTFQTAGSFAIIVTIGPAGSMPGGGDPDCPTINDAEADVAAGVFSARGLSSKNIASQGVTVHYKLYGTWRQSGGELISGWTTNDTYRLKIVPGTTYPSIFDDSDTDYGGYILRLESEYVDINGIHLIANNSSPGPSIYDNDRALRLGGTNYHEIENCIFESYGTRTSGGNYCTDANGSHILFHNCTFTGDDNDGSWGVYSGATDEYDIEIRYCTFKNFKDYSASQAILELENVTDVRIHHNIFYNNTYNDFTIKLIDIQNCSVYNNIIGANGTNGGINIEDTLNGASSQRSYVVNNTIYGIYQNDEGVYFNDLDDGITYCYNNVIYLTDDGGGTYDAYGIRVRYTTSANLVCNYNCVYRSLDQGCYGKIDYGVTGYTLADWQSGTDWGDNSKEVDPTFVTTDYGNSQFLHITETSPCASAGLNLADQGFTFITDDVDGDSRPGTGEAWSMGADEPFVQPMPLAPADLYCDDLSTGAQSGRVDPEDIRETPVFSAIYDDENLSQTAASYRVQVGTDDDWAAAELWDSGVTALGSSVSAGARSEDIAYEGSSLSADTVYYWRIMFVNSDSFDSPWSASAYFRTVPEPQAPTTLYCNDSASGASSGQTNPDNITDFTPVFSAIYNDGNASGLAVQYEIQVGTDDDWAAAEMWDTGNSALSSTVSEGARTPDVEYNGAALSPMTTYYWRIRLVNQNGQTSPWSSSAHFTTGAVDVPQKPGMPFCNDSAEGAQVGYTNPIDLTDPTPAFSAIYYDDVPSEMATHCEIEVGDDDDWTTAEMWDSGWTALSYDVPQGERIPDTVYGGTAITTGTYYWRIRIRNSSSLASPWSDTQFFIVTTAGLPDKVSGPTPADGATGVSPSTTCSWSASSGATGYAVYMGTSDPPTTLVQNSSATTYNASLSSLTTYYWRVDSWNAQGTAAGDVWSFTTSALPSKAANPDPADGAVDVPADTVILHWDLVAGADGYVVYFGTDPGSLENRGAVDSPLYSPGALEENTQYYWRIDPYNSSGSVTGDVWTFTTGENSGYSRKSGGDSCGCMIPRDKKLTTSGLIGYLLPVIILILLTAILRRRI